MCVFSEMIMWHRSVATAQDVDSDGEERHGEKQRQKEMNMGKEMGYGGMLSNVKKLI